MVSDEVELISDGDGLAVIGEPAAVERFLMSTGLPSTDLGLQRLGAQLGHSAGIVQTGSEVVANSGRWMKLTKESAELARRSDMVKNATTGNYHATLRAKDGGQFVRSLEFVRNPSMLLTNPAVLAGAAGIMAQLAMQQTMAEITDYLATIDGKVDDVLRAQKDAVLADMIGVGFVVDEAMTVRDEVGRVSEITWSKVQAASATIARTQAYAAADRCARRQPGA